MRHLAAQQTTQTPEKESICKHTNTHPHRLRLGCHKVYFKDSVHCSETVALCSVVLLKKTIRAN